ncbi:protein I'm not dead yet-like [Copidosoma floridanum]|uniref:protein I'm not dead yet-like n=1 Tax=Copidosoma floridanum TaxID=29053 RepID=UPI0006C99EF9|nr:protein I'm not dead yet-like [Copidosoma floridanum]
MTRKLGKNNTSIVDMELSMNDKSKENPQAKDATFGTLLGNFINIYWKTLVVVIWPLILMPLVILNNEQKYRCLFVVALMSVYWVTEVIPLPITGLLPIVLYPLLGVMDTEDTCKCYMNDTTMMFVGSLVIALAIEHSGLHMRVAFVIIKFIGCGHRKLSLGLFLVTMFISMWISNTAATAMMLPIVETVLMELEAQGLGKMFVQDEDEDEDSESPKRPTKLTMGYYLAIAYASSIGGIGTLVGTGTNLTLKGIYESTFPKSPGINFAAWMVYAVPVMIIMGLLTWLWLQVMYMGLFRPSSREAKAIDIGDEGEKIAASVIEAKHKELGPVTWHESCIGILFVTILMLWFFRKPDFINGWPKFITTKDVKDSTAAVGLIILMFVLPSRLDFLSAFSSDPNKRPKKRSPGLMCWKLIMKKMHWGLIFVLGGGFAIATGSRLSQLSDTLGHALVFLQKMNFLAILAVVCLFAETVTELTSNVAVANIILPVLADMAKAIKIHPLYLMVPAALGCSFSFHLPVGTPPNAIVSAAAKIKTKDFVIAGIGPSLITAVVVPLSFATWGVYAFNLDDLPMEMMDFN